MIQILFVVCLLLLVIGLIFPYRIYRLAKWVSKHVAPKFSIGLAFLYPALFFLALAGLCRQDGAPLCMRSFLESARLYGAVQVMLHNWTPAGEMGGMMEFVLIAAPLALILTFIPVAANILERVLPGFAMRRMRGHVIIVGTGDKSRQLTADFLAESKRKRGLKRGIIVVGDDPEDHHRDFCERHSVLYTGCGGNLEETLWKHCAVRRAETLALVDDDDDRNLGAFLRVLKDRAELAVAAVNSPSESAGEAKRENRPVSHGRKAEPPGGAEPSESNRPALRILLHLASPDVLATFDLQRLAEAALAKILRRDHYGPSPSLAAYSQELLARAKVYPYNIHRNAVLNLFNAKLFPRLGAPAWLDSGAGKSLRVVIAGHGYVGRQALECVLHLAHPPNDGKNPAPRRIEVDVVDQQICESCEGADCDLILADNLQHTGKVARIRTIGRNLLHPDLIRRWTEWTRQHAPPVFIISLGGESSDLDNIEAATRLTNRFIAAGCPAPLIFVRTARQHGTGSWRDIQTSATTPNPKLEEHRIHPFGMIGETSSLEGILAQKVEIRAALADWSWSHMNNACSSGRMNETDFEQADEEFDSLLPTCASLLGGRSRELAVKWKMNRFPALHAPVRIAMLEDDRLFGFYRSEMPEHPAWATAAYGIRALKNEVKEVLNGTKYYLEKGSLIKALKTLENTALCDPDRLELKTLVVHGLTIWEFESTREDIIDLMQQYRELHFDELSLRDLAFMAEACPGASPENDSGMKHKEGFEAQLVRWNDERKKNALRSICRSKASHSKDSRSASPAQDAGRKAPLLAYLGQHEHTRWVAEKWLSGNTSHPCLVDDDELPHIMQILDQIQVAFFAAHELISSARESTDATPPNARVKTLWRKLIKQRSMQMTISFYSQADEIYGVFSNYEKSHPIEVDGRTWPSVEHYYQHERLTGHPEIQKQIAEAKWPGRAKLVAHRNLHLVDPAWWEAAREEIMLKALRGKFGQHKKLRDLLLSTDEAELVEASPSDAYWGRQPDGSGANRLGVLLMQVRGELRENPH